MDIEAVSAELYEAPRADFIPLRDERAKQARSVGDRDLATQITALRKPTVAAWLVNQATREYPDDIDRIAELGAQLRRAHQELAADRLRELSRQRNELLRVLDDRTLRVARRAAVAVNDQVADQVRDAFVAALLDPEVLDSMRSGQLSNAPSAAASTGWPTLETIPAPPKKPAAKEAATKQPATAKPLADKQTAPAEPAASKAASSNAAASKTAVRDDERKREVAARRRAELSSAKQEARIAETARAKAERELTAARAGAEQADTELDDARKRVEQARFAQRAAKLTAAAAQQNFDSAQRNAAAAERAVAALEKYSR